MNGNLGKPFALFFLILIVGVSFSTAAQQVSKRAEQVSNPNESADESRENSKKLSLKDIVYIATPILSLLGVGLIVIYTRRNVQAEHWLKTNEKEAEYLQEKLDNFFGPFIMISNSNHLIAQDLRARQPNPTEYRLLEKLFDESWLGSLSEGDQALVKDICKTGKRLHAVVEAHSGLVDPEILPYISRAMAHFKILNLAYKRKLGTDKQPFLRYVYPQNLDPVLRLELRRLQDRVALLRQEPTKAHGKLPPLALSDYPLADWPDPARPEFDEATGELQAPEDPNGSSLLVPRTAGTEGGWTPSLGELGRSLDFENDPKAGPKFEDGIERHKRGWHNFLKLMLLATSGVAALLGLMALTLL